MHSKVLIIGSGPAGYSAAIYAARAALEPIMISGSQPGGQLTITTDVENYPGFAEAIQGPWLMDQMKLQALHVGSNIVNDHVTEIDVTTKPFKILCQSGSVYTSHTIIISSGAQARWLGLESEDRFKGFGVSGCATCDGFFYKNKRVAVVGGGNSAVEEAIYLTNHASEVFLIHRKNALRAEKISQERLFKNPKIKIIWDTVVEEILGNDPPIGVTGLRMKNLLSNEETSLDVSGVFIAIGHTPNTSLFRDKIELDQDNYIVTKDRSTLTNIPGIFAAGDVQDKIYRQAVTAAGTGCMAALDALKYLQENELV